MQQPDVPYLRAALDEAERKVETMTYVAQSNKRHLAELIRYTEKVEVSQRRLERFAQRLMGLDDKEWGWIGLGQIQEWAKEALDGEA